MSDEDFGDDEVERITGDAENEKISGSDPDGDEKEDTN